MTKVYSAIDNLGIIRWYKKDDEGYSFYHKENGPAIEYPNGDKRWYQNGRLHRTDGPASIEIGGYHYYLYGMNYPNIQTDEEWVIFQIIN